jgi:hypothetical protein
VEKRNIKELPNPMIGWVGSMLATGELVDITADGHPLVIHEESGDHPVEADVTGFVRQNLKELLTKTPCKVLLAFASGHKKPVVVDTIETAPFSQPLDVHYTEAGNISLKANERLSLKCGQAEIVLRGDGKLFIRGLEVTSRSLAKNRIRGSLVEIN